MFQIMNVCESTSEYNLYQNWAHELTTYFFNNKFFDAVRSRRSKVTSFSVIIQGFPTVNSIFVNFKLSTAVTLLLPVGIRQKS